MGPMRLPLDEIAKVMASPAALVSPLLEGLLPTAHFVQGALLDSFHFHNETSHGTPVRLRLGRAGELIFGLNWAYEAETPENVAERAVVGMGWAEEGMKTRWTIVRVLHDTSLHLTLWPGALLLVRRWTDSVQNWANNIFSLLHPPVSTRSWQEFRVPGSVGDRGAVYHCGSAPVAITAVHAHTKVDRFNQREQDFYKITFTPRLPMSLLSSTDQLQEMVPEWKRMPRHGFFDSGPSEFNRLYQEKLRFDVRRRPRLEQMEISCFWGNTQLLILPMVSSHYAYLVLGLNHIFVLHLGEHDDRPSKDDCFRPDSLPTPFTVSRLEMTTSQYETMDQTFRTYSSRDADQMSARFAAVLGLRDWCDFTRTLVLPWGQADELEAMEEC